jgi:hypothetical protein
MSDDLLTELAQFQDDPYGFVLWAFPWGEPGTELENRSLEAWQEQELKDIRDQLRAGKWSILEARTSGHGVGKSALAAWIILWALTTMANTKGVVTANTEKQLKTKTWATLSTWFGLFIAKDLFEFNATCLKVKTAEVDEGDRWKVDMVPWSIHNTEAFAGMHNLGRRVLMLMDEASAIPDVIWETAEGALTDLDTQVIWCVFGNPTRNKGRFRDCFEGGKFAHRWRSRRVDSREVSFTNKNIIQSWIDDYGEDSDFVRVRVRGIFPRVDSESFISYASASEAVTRDLELRTFYEPLILGVDVGRFGDDPTVVCPRRGRDAASLPWAIYFGQNLMDQAARIADLFISLKAHVVMIDSGGVGGGLVDRLRMLNIPLLEVDFGSAPLGTNIQDGTKYANKRAEIWGAMRDWLREGKIPERIQGLEVSMVDELTGPKFGLNAAEALLLESKKDMRRRGVKSPNCADALACTFAFPVYVPLSDTEREREQQITEDYNPYSRERMVA